MIGNVITVESAGPRDTCPTCGTRTTPVNGHRALCFDCSLDELPPGAWEKSKAASNKLAAKAAKKAV